MLLIVLVQLALFLVVSGFFAYESYREEQPRALKIGVALIFLEVILAAIVIFLPASRTPAVILLSSSFAMLALFSLPGKKNTRALKGAGGYVSDGHKRVDERDIIFARLRSLLPGTERYDNYYMASPEFKYADDRRRGM